MDVLQIQEIFSDFGMTFDGEDSDLLEQLRKLRNIYSVEAEDLIDEMVAHLTNIKERHFESGMLDAVEKKLASKAEKNRRLSSVKRPVISDFRQPLREKVLKLDMTAEEDSEMDSSMMSEIDTSSGAVQLQQKYKDFTISKLSPGNSKYYTRPDIGRTCVQHKGKFYEKAAPEGEVVIDILSNSPSNVYAKEKVVNVIDEKHRWLHNFAVSVLEANPEIKEFGQANEINGEEVYVYGEIISDGPTSFKVDESTVYLQCDDDDGSIVKLDMSNLQEFSLFSGQAVCFLGVNDDGTSFIPSKQLFGRDMSPAKIEHKTDSVSVWTASGPFTWGESISFEPLIDLLEKVKQEQPDVLILMGPVLDRRNIFLLSPQCDVTYEYAMDKLMFNIGESMKGFRTQIIVQPSPSREATIIPSYPTPPIHLSDKKARNAILGSNIHFVPDPCVLRVNGIEIAFTGNEALSHLSKSEWYKAENKENVDRFARLYSNFFRQSSLLPLCPVEIPLDAESLYSACSLTNTPHMLITPCILVPQIKLVSGCLCINPGLLCRGAAGGTFMRSEITISQAPEGPGSIVDYANVIVEKI